MAETAYNVYKLGLLEGTEPWETGDYRVLLLTGAVTIEPDHATVAAVLAVNTEASDASYARVTITTQTATQDDAADRAEGDLSDADFGALTNETPTAALVFRQVTGDADSIPALLYDTGFGVTANGAGYTVSFPNNAARLS